MVGLGGGFLMRFSGAGEGDPPDRPADLAARKPLNNHSGFLAVGWLALAMDSRS
ncbi:MAG: hypothetical protein ACK41W_16775 [Cyanobacteriota bacterium]